MMNLSNESLLALTDDVSEDKLMKTSMDVNPLWIKLGLIGAAVALFGLAYVGLSQLVLTINSSTVGDQAPEAAKHFFLAVDLLVIPLLLLGVLIGTGARYFDRLRLMMSFMERLNKLQSRLNYREDLLRLVADHRSGAIAIFDQQNRYWFVNQPAAEGIGKTVMEIIGRPLSRTLGNERARRLEVRLAEARASEEPLVLIDRVTDNAGQTRFIQSRYESIGQFAEFSGGVIVSEEDLTRLIVERERRERMLRQVIDTLVAVVDRRDPYASGHSSRVGQLAHAIAEEMELEPKLVETAEISGSLMNFGKVLVSRSILTKTTPLTPDELQRVRDSILVSADILSIIGFEGPVVPTLRQVLERFDGSGAPIGLKDDAILITARIVAAANAFVAFVSPRAHRDGLPFKDALQQMMGDADHIYDRRVLIALSNYIENRPNKLDWLTSSKQG
jgi:PAS domain S-box-containing protein